MSANMWRQHRQIIFLMLVFPGVYARPLFAAGNTIIQHRAVVDQNEPDLPNETKTIIGSEDAQGSLRLRCQPEQGLRVEIYYHRLKSQADVESRVEMKYSTDEGSISIDKAWPTGENRAILPNGRQILEDALRSSAMHIQIGPATSMVFRPKNVSEALSKIQANCPSDAPPPDHNGLAK